MAQNLIELSEAFKISYGNSLELNRLDILETNETKGINFVARVSKNNGIVARVKQIDTKPFSAGLLTVAVSGSVLETFLQIQPFYTSYHVMTLEPINKMSEKELIYYALCIRKNKYKYSFGRQANRTLKNILVPSEVPKSISNLKLPKIKKMSSNKREFSLSDRKWEWFKIQELFAIGRGKCGSAEKLLEKGNEISYIGAKKEENGFMYKVAKDEKFITKGDCIVFIGDGQGSVGYSTYQPDNFIGSTTLSIGRNKNINKYTGIFLVTILDKERFKYSFGRKWNGDKLKNTKIKLPVDSSSDPDWQFMEDYIKSLPYSKSL